MYDKRVNPLRMVVHRPEIDYKQLKTNWNEAKITHVGDGCKRIAVNVSGTCGTDITWTLDDAGNIVLTGSGSMENYSYTGPWETKVKTVKMSEGITTIGDAAFRFNELLTTIGSGSFNECKSLADVTIPDNVTTIVDYAFQYCEALTEVVIPNVVTKIGYRAFAFCTNLKTVTIGSSVTGIINSAFRDVSLTKILSLATTPPKIASGTFQGTDVNTCIVEVPKGSVDAYKARIYWGNFANIVEYGGIDGVTADDGVTVRVDGGAIAVDGASDASMEVYSISGVVVYRGVAATVTVPTSGMYIVRVAGTTAKVVVR